MRTRICFIICVAAAALFIAACSSTTVVSSDDRAAAGDDSDAAATFGDDGADTAADDETPEADPDTASPDDADPDADPDADEPDDDRGERDPAAGVDLNDGFGLGGAEQLEALLTDCEAGSDLACDILFQLSAFDSAEEIAALTCGGRSEVEVLFCTEGVDALSNELSFDPDSEGLARVVSQCEDDGDMTACDFLYYRSPIDSTFEEVGATCGGRVTVAVPDCRTLLADDE